jgi:hypothetical protein
MVSRYNDVRPAGGGQFPLIGDYGFLSDCETTALVADALINAVMAVIRADRAELTKRLGSRREPQRSIQIMPQR